MTASDSFWTPPGYCPRVKRSAVPEDSDDESDKWSSISRDDDEEGKSKSQNREKERDQKFQNAD